MTKEIDDTKKVESGTTINRFGDVHEKLHRMVKKGLAYHLCDLIHDQLVQITQLEQMGRQPRGGPPVLYQGRLASVSEFCSDMHDKFGCAHAGADEEIYDGYNRTKMSTARLVIIEGIELLRKYAPEILSEKDAENFKKEIENNGLWIAMADINMTKDRNQGRENENIQNHRIYVEKVFNIAEKIDNLIIQAVSQNRGQETITVEPDRSSEEIEWHSPGVTASEEDWNKLIKLLKSEGNSFQASS